MAAVFLDPVPRDWYCPNCRATHQTLRADVHTPMHTCPALHGLDAPFVEAGMSAAVRAVVREDYLNGDDQTRDDLGRPVMAVVRERADGTDVWVNAPCIRIQATI